MVLSYTVLFSAVSILGFRNFGMSAYDIGIHDQAIWKLATGRGIFNTIRGLNIWGDHCWFIMVLIAPLYWVAPRIETILVLQSLALAAAAIPLALLAHRRSGSYLLALLLAAAWLLSPALQNMNLENFHPEVLAAPFLLWAVERADARSWKWYWPAIGIALLCKEDVALTVFMLGFWLLLRQNWRIGGATMLLSAVWFVLCMKVFLPYFNGYGFFRFSGGYWFSQFWAQKWVPSFYQHAFINATVGAYVWKLCFPLLFASVLNPLLLLAALPAFGVNVLSGNGYLISIDYHYNFQSLPMLFAAAALGLAWLGGRGKWGRIVMGLWAVSILAASAWANNNWSRLPACNSVRRPVALYQQLRNTPYDARFKRLAAYLPADRDIPISVSHNLVPHLAHRNEIYMFPNPYKASYWGIAGENLPPSDRVRAIFIDRSTLNAECMPVIKRLLATGEFKIAAEEGGLFVATWQPMPQRKTVLDPFAEPPPAHDIRFLVYPGKAEVTSLSPTFSASPTLDSTTDRLAIPITAGNLATADGMDIGASHNVRVVFIGQWQAQGERDILFRVRVDDGCRLYVDNKLVLDRGGINSMSYPEESKPIRLSAGPHKILLDYFQWGGEAGLTVEYRAATGSAYVPLRAGAVLP